MPMQWIRYHRPLIMTLWMIWLGVMTPREAMALEPDEVLILANSNAKDSVALATYYAKKRDIPAKHLLLLSLPTEERCSRDIYEKKIAAPVRAFLATIKPAWRIRCLVLMYGLPLKVVPSKTGGDGDVEALKNRQRELQRRLKNQNAADDADSHASLAAELADIRNQLKKSKITTDQEASVDSELSIVRVVDAPAGGWIENPFYVGFQNRSVSVSKKNVLMVSRLDGPSSTDVIRIIDDTIEAEKHGLNGSACFDARWPKSEKPPESGYQLYDQSLHKAARRVGQSGRLAVVVDDNEALFQPGQCPDAALYCGWYSLATYVDAFKWQPGAIGFHIASSECTTLKKENSQVWCKRMIEEGVCATLGPVGEPYVQAFPMPELFFGLLSEGILSLAEVYFASLPFLSWKMVLIGDPLYHPFEFKPRDAHSR